jgi:ubiquinone/menaquinone biosynthesis C-methylase UbiE
MAWFLRNPYMVVFCPPSWVVANLRLKPGFMVLDFGCGDGRISIPASRQILPGGRISCLDMQKGMLRLLAANIGKNDVKNIDSKRALAKELSLHENYYDRIILTTVLGEVPKRIELLRALGSSLKKDGMISITECLPDACYVTRNSLKKLCQQADLQLIEEVRTPLSYTANYRRK